MNIRAEAAQIVTFRIWGLAGLSNADKNPPPPTAVKKERKKNIAKGTEQSPEVVNQYVDSSSTP